MKKELSLVAFVGQKGGVGKSSLARLLAVAAGRAGHKVLLADFDLEQLTCVEWNAARLRRDIAPEIDVRAFKSLKKLRKTEENFDLIVADTRGLADDLTKDVAEESSVVFCRPARRKTICALPSPSPAASPARARTARSP